MKEIEAVTDSGRITLWDDNQNKTVTVEKTEIGHFVDKEYLMLSYQEARILRDLLNDVLE